MSNDEGMTNDEMCNGMCIDTAAKTSFDIRHSCFVILNVQISDV
jgi:hypothetical protein